MEMMGLMACIVNCALIGQSGQVHRMFPNITPNQTIILIVILEVRIPGQIKSIFLSSVKSHLTLYSFKKD